MRSSHDCVSVFVLAKPLVRWGLERLLRSAGAQLSITGISGSLAEAIPQLQASFPDAVVVDLDDYAEHEIQELQHTCGSVIGLSSSRTSEATGEPATQGLAAYLHMRTAPAAFVRTVLQVSSARRAVDDTDGLHSQGEARRGVDGLVKGYEAAWHSEALTPKQREIVRAVTLHASAPAKVIAAKLHISEHTLRNHLSEIYSRLGVKRRTHLQAIVTGQVNSTASNTWLSVK